MWIGVGRSISPWVGTLDSIDGEKELRSSLYSSLSFLVVYGLDQLSNICSLDFLGMMDHTSNSELKEMLSPLVLSLGYFITAIRKDTKTLCI